MNWLVWFILACPYAPVHTVLVLRVLGGDDNRTVLGASAYLVSIELSALAGLREVE